MKMAGQELTPRSYQKQLMQIALKQNTIIYLPTGAGKTFIALMVLKTLSGSLIPSYKNGGKLSCILVNSVALADQHAKYVRDHTILTVGAYTGEMNLDGWRKEKWEEEFDKYQVLIMTCQILLNLLNNNFISLERLNLIIFDECHRGVDDQPMRQVMKNFQNVKDQPRIIGLTATLLNGNCKLNRVTDEVRNLEITYHSQVATVDGLEDVIGFSTNPKEEFKICSASNPSSAANIVINGLSMVDETLSRMKMVDVGKNINTLPGNLKLLEPRDVLKKLRNLIKDLIIHIKMLGSFGGYKACVAYMIQIERLKKHCDETFLFAVLNYVMTMIGWGKTVLKKTMQSYTPKEKIFKFSSDKVLKLLEIIDEYKTKSTEDLCCLIFVQRRFTAKIIHHIIDNLKDVDQAFSHLKSNFVVGNNNSPYSDTRENLYISKKNREVLNTFINKEINVLVSSNVLEEGVDIPKCTLVIKFDKSEDYRSYIQSKGRARHKESLYYTIVESDVQDKFLSKYQDFQRIEQLLNEFLVGQNLERDNPSEDDINSMYNEDDLPPYYVNGPNSAQVNMYSAVSLLCRYCSSLASDQYTTYAPEWFLDEDTNGSSRVRVIILLPVVCPIRDSITGPFMVNKKIAKRAAALQACIMLHKAKELDDNLLPFKKELKEEDVQFLFKHWPTQKENDAGVKKKKRLHSKEVTPCLKGKIMQDQILHLHVIKLNPQYSPREDFNLTTILNLYKSKLCFGLISSKPLPDLCKFPLFDSHGGIEVDVKVNVKEIIVSQKEISQLQEFHYLIFNDILEILKSFLLFDNTGNQADMLLVVPVQDDVDVNIDFELIQRHKSLKNKNEPTSSERTNLHVTDETYLHKIVSPWYRTEPTMYVVTQVCPEKCPLSPFPNQDYTNFMTYFREKHSLTILKTNQPLLLVKGLSKKRNTFKPVGREAKRKKDKRYEEMEEYLIPELVIKQEFPSCLWVQSRFLPSVLSRLVYLIKLRQLQEQIAREIGAKEVYLKNCPSLELDIHLLNYVPVENQPITESESSITLMDISNCPPLENPGNLINRQYNKDLAMKMLESEYSWKNIEEPKDIERNLDVTVMDIEYYETFISEKSSKQSRLLKNGSPHKSQKLPAITYNKEFEKKYLRLLDIKFDNQCPDLCYFYQALTTSEANDIVNLERLETLGDSFLKFIASLYIILKFPNYNEGNSTALKGKLVSNKNLFYLALKKNLGGILKNNDFLPNEEWVPPSFCVPSIVINSLQNKEYSLNTLFNLCIPPEEQISGNLSRRTLNEMINEEITADEENLSASMCNFLNKQYVSDKTMADCVEALLGAHFLKGGITGGIKFVEWIGILPKSEKVEKMIKETVHNPILNPKATKENVDFHLPQWQELEKRLGYHFKNRAFLLQAITHSSYSPNRITQSYERLEFIGDAILDFLITCYIYEHCGYLDPGQVTDLRSALVNNNTFASLVVRCGFHKFLLMINVKLQGHIDKFAEYLAAKNDIDDEVLILLEAEDMNLAECVDVPKVLGDIFEALAGAVYLDSNKDLKTVWAVFYKIMWREIDLFSKNVPKNLIRRLYECHTAYPRFTRASEINSHKTVVALEFMCNGRRQVVHGFGSNKTMAKRAAAKIALRSLKV